MRTTSLPNSYIPAVDVEALPGVHLRHNRGGYLVHRCRTKGSLGPGHTMEGDPEEFLIIPLKEVVSSNADERPSQEATGAGGGEENPSGQPPSLTETFDSSYDDSAPPAGKRAAGKRSSSDTLSSQEYEEAMLRSTQVAIAHRAKDGTLRYISCRREIPMMKRSMAEYRTGDIGSFEAFKPEYCFHTNTYSLKSHNDQYLYWSTTLNSVQFKTEATESTKWQVEAVELSAKIAYLGVLSFAGGSEKNISFLTETVAPGLPLDREDFLAMVRILKECHKPGECWMTCFEKPEDGTRWIVKTNEESVCFLLIASQHYPKFVGMECVDDLQAHYEVKYKKLYDNNNNQAPSEAVRERYSKELFAQRLHYEDLESVWETEVPEEIKASMQVNFEGLTRNIERAQELKQKASQLEEDAKIFRRKAKEFKAKSKGLNTRAIILAVGASAGATFGWLLGGPVGAAALGSQTAEIAVFTAMGLAGSSALNSALDSSRRFWTYKFVRVAARPKFSMKHRSFYRSTAR